MIKVNDNEIKYKSGMTVQDALNSVKYSFRMVIVSVNGKHIAPDKLSEYKLKDGDTVRVMHIEGGG